MLLLSIFTYFPNGRPTFRPTPFRPTGFGSKLFVQSYQVRLGQDWTKTRWTKSRSTCCSMLLLSIFAYCPDTGINMLELCKLKYANSTEFERVDKKVHKIVHGNFRTMLATSNNEYIQIWICKYISDIQIYFRIILTIANNKPCQTARRQT